MRQPFLEIERKFLLPHLPGVPLDCPVHIRQGYITAPEDSAEIRIRQKETLFLMTVKKGKGMVREEIEFGIDAETFHRLWMLTRGQQVAKVRYKMRLDNGQTAEIDSFEGALAGLVLCEVEFADQGQAQNFVPPGWFGQEVTMNPAYKNSWLARNGIPGKGNVHIKKTDPQE